MNCNLYTFNHRHFLKKIVQALLIILFVSFQVSAQDTVPVEAQKGFEAISANEMKAILSFLASDELEGRGTTQRGLQLAEKFLESQYALAGLTPAPGERSMLQTFFVLESKMDKASSISVIKNSNGSKLTRKFSLYIDFFVRAQGSQSLTIDAPVVFAGYGLNDSKSGYNDYKGLNVKGKIVLVMSGRPSFASPGAAPGRSGESAKIEAAKSAGAIAVFAVARQSIPEQYARFKRWIDRPSMTLQNQKAGFPQFTISNEVANLILAESGNSIESLKEKIETTKKPNSFNVQNTTINLDVLIHTEAKKTQNVVAYLEGSDPNLSREVVAFGAHYDHLGISEDGTIFNGADDDGSGTTGILEVARAFARNPNPPKRSLLFVSHSGEEKGLLGSRYYTDNPIIPLKNTVAQLNVDMIGRNEDNDVYIIGSDFISTELHNLNETANQVVGLNLDYKYNNVDDPERFYFRSDHYNYAKHDIPIIFYFTGTHDDYHKETDDVRKIKFGKMEKIARLIYLTGWNVANLDHSLSKDGKMMTAVE